MEASINKEFKTDRFTRKEIRVEKRNKRKQCNTQQSCFYLLEWIVIPKRINNLMVRYFSPWICKHGIDKNTFALNYLNLLIKLLHLLFQYLFFPLIIVKSRLKYQMAKGSNWFVFCLDFILWHLSSSEYMYWVYHDTISLHILKPKTYFNQASR